MTTAAADGELPAGLYEAVLSTQLEALLQGVADPHLGPVDDADAAHVLTAHVARELRTELAGRSRGRQLELVSTLLTAIQAVDADPVLDGDGRAQHLLGVFRATGLTTRRPRRPATPLSEAALLTNSPAEPSLVHELRAELESADAVDLLCAFVKWSGLSLLREPLLALRERGAPLRVITTTYLGATERRAVDALVAEYGAEVRIAYEEHRTRLHAKAWIFRRNTGYDTAYVGSSNLSHAALTEGLEWNVRLSGVATRELLEKFEATFTGYWQSATFQPYDPPEHADRLDAALRAASGLDRGTRLGNPFTLEVTARPHQQEMLDHIAGERQLHDRHRNLVVAATGTGKTVLAALDYRDLCRRHGRSLSLLFVVHRREILEQARSTYRQVLAEGSFGELLVGGERPGAARHVFASIQSLTPQRIDSLDPPAYDVVVLDECHHGTAESYARLLQHLQPLEFLGLTATPERSDGADVLALFDGRVATELRLWDALAGDLLVPFHYYGVNDDTDLTSIAWNRGRYDSTGLERVFTGNDARARLVLRELDRRVPDVDRMRALGFCVGVAHAEYMARVFRDAGIPAAAVTGRTGSAERAAALHSLRTGEVRILFTVDLFNEGIDLPDVDTVLFLRPTESATVFLQQLGRGLRTAHGKAALTVLDFVGQHRKEFRFDARFRALTGVSRGSLPAQVEKGFPFLPAGCSIVLDRVVQGRVLESLRHQLSPRTTALVGEVRTQGTGRLAEFLDESGYELREILRPKRSWAALRRAAGLPLAVEGPAETTLQERVKAFGHVDDPQRRAAYLNILTGDPADAPEAYQRMLAASLWPGAYPSDVGAALDGLRPDIAFRDDAAQVVDYAFDHARLPTTELPGALARLPLQVHARYSRDEIVAALGVGSARRSPSTFREGEVWAPELNVNAMLVTLAKSEAEYSPTTMYRDYPVSRDLFHWESQARTRQASSQGRRYVHHRETNTAMLLFVRQHKNGDLGVEPYLFLGPVDYVAHHGERPMAITWKLRFRMPSEFFEAGSLIAPAG